MFLRTIQDLEAIEHVPLAARLTVHSTYELIREAATKDPEHTAIAFLSGGDRMDRPAGDVVFPQTGEVYALTLSGSGAFISAHGDILTAVHLVTPPSQVLAGVAAPDVTNYVNQHLTYGVQLTTDRVAQELASGQIESDAVYSSKSSEVYLSTDYTGPLHATDLKDLPGTVHQPIDRIEEESAFAQKDVAIVHAPFNDTASVQPADSSQVEPLDALTIIGFPSNGDVRAPQPTY